MNTFTPRSRGSRRAWHLIAGVVIVIVLVLQPPALPHFGPSLVTPLTTSTLSQLALLLAWIVLLVLALALLQQALVPDRALVPPAWATRAPRRPTPRPSPFLREKVVAPRLLLQGEAALATAPPKTTEAPGRGATGEVRAREPIVGIALLGPVKIDGVRRPRRATTVELLAYLALHPDGAGRDELLEAIWPGEDPQRTRPRLWQAVSEARRLLGDAFERDGERYRLDREQVAIDVEKMDRIAEADQALPDLERALALWRGPPLGGSDYAWADGHVRRLESALATLLGHVGRARLTSGDAVGALAAAERGLRLDRLSEPFLRLALEADAALGQRERLTERYDAFRDRLEADLGLEPERETRLLHRRLLAPEPQCWASDKQPRSSGCHLTD